MRSLLALALCVAYAASSRVENSLTHRESFPADFQAELVATLSTTLSVTAVAALAALILGRVRGIRLPTVLMLCMWSALLVVGIVAWVVTYVTTRDVIEDTKEMLIKSSAGFVTYRVKHDLEAGVLLVELFQRHVQTGMLDIREAWPVPHLYMNQVMRTVATSSDAVLLLYMGTVQGKMQGVKPIGPGKEVHYTGLHPNDTFAPWIQCPTKDYSGDCKAHVDAGNCSSGTRLDRLCLSSCGVPGPSRANCYSTATSGHMLVHPVLNNNGVGDFEAPPEAEQFLVILPNFDPRTRPWYSSADKPVWVDPYPFGTEGSGVGITVASRVYDASRTRVGTVAVDYNLASMHKYLRDIGKITPNTITIVITLKWIVVGASLDDAALQADSGVVDLQNLLNVTKFTNPKSRISRMFGVVTRRFQSLEGAMGGSAMLQESGDIVMSYPIEVRGGLRLLMGVIVPYDDVMGKANDASLMALLLAVAISVVCALLTMGAITVLLRPLRQLQGDMIDVAEMRLEGHNEAKPPCTLLEMREMQAAFLQMVVNLVEYRQYLPQSVLCDGSDAEEEPSSAALSATGRKTASHVGTTSHDTFSKRSGGGGERNANAFSHGLRSRTLTLLIVNVKNFSGLIKELESDDLISLHEHYISIIVSTTKNLRGMVDEFSGDHVSISFNTLLTAAAHKFKAVECAMHLIERVTESPVENTSARPLEVNTAVATGKGLVGNMGCSSMKKFTVLAHTCVLVRVLERWGAHWGVKCLTDGVVGADVSVSYVTRKVVKIRVKDSTQMLCEVVSASVSANEEWMYQLEKNDAENPCAIFNKAIDFAYNGMYDEAKDALDKCPESLQVWVEKLRSLVTASEAHGGPLPPLDSCSVPSLGAPPLT